MARRRRRRTYRWRVTTGPSDQSADNQSADDQHDDRIDGGVDDDAADPFAGLGALFGSGGLGSMQDLLAQAQQMQTDLADTQRRLADTHVSGTSGGGLVRATVTGDRDLVALSIDPSVVDPADIETLADLVVAAVRAANDHARTVGEQAMAGAVPDLSGLGLGGGFPGDGDFGPSVPGGAATASLPPVVPADADARGNAELPPGDASRAGDPAAAGGTGAPDRDV